MRAGDILLAYSDGIIESRDDEDQEFGYERLKAELLRARTGSADDALFSVLGAVQDFAAARKQADDMSIVVIRRRRRQPAPAAFAAGGMRSELSLGVA